ncbi:MAG: class I SAM-dependent methyltransferase [Solirubrobacteraceae bacterium]
MTDDRLAREREFHDTRFADADGVRPADRFYAINHASDGYFRAALDELSPEARVLDYGCGSGAYVALHAAGNGNRVTAIDLSPVAIETARARAVADGVQDLIDFRVMDAEHLDLESRSFDFVCGLGVIHHLDIEASLAEVARVMTPEATAVFVEPMGHNPAINLYRRRTPEQRTVDEHPLLMSDMDLIRRRFGQVEATYFHLFGLLALPLRNRRRFNDLLGRLDAVDEVALRTPLRRFAWMVALRLSSPLP